MKAKVARSANRYARAEFTANDDLDNEVEIKLRWVFLRCQVRKAIPCAKDELRLSRFTRGTKALGG